MVKHGLSLKRAEEFEWQSAAVWPDTRHHYGEARMVAIGYIGFRLHCIVFVDRTSERRVISLRKANDREVKRYAKA